jgi:hypothetical protein
MELTNYQEEYDLFLKDYHSREVGAEEMGAYLARLAQVFAFYNMRLVASQREVNLVARDIENRTDASGKAITSAKAKVLVEASDEYDKYNTFKAHIECVEQYMSAVRALQRGAMAEMGHMANT